MGNIRRGIIANNFTDRMKLEGNPPNKASDSVVLTFDYSNVNRCDIVRNSGATTSGTLTVYTTPSDEDFYLNSIFLSISKDVNCDLVSGPIQMQGTIDGAVRRLVTISTTTLTAQYSTVVISFPIPVRLDRNTTVQIGGTFTAGLMYREGGITGFTVKG